MFATTATTQSVRVEDPKEDRVDVIRVSARLTVSTARRVAKNSFAVRYGADPTRLRTRHLG